MTKAELRTEIRRRLYESAADLWSNTDIDAFARSEILSLPAKGIYKEEIFSTDFVANQEDYLMPTGAFKIEKVEINTGTALSPTWQKQDNGWDHYAGSLWFSPAPSTVETFRAFLKMNFTDLDSYLDAEEIDVPEDKMEVVILGAALRGYSALMGYFVDLKNWDYNAKPDGISMNQVQAWIRDMKEDYMTALRYSKKASQPRFIDLTG
jgi:hypothetical protein